MFIKRNLLFLIIFKAVIHNACVYAVEFDPEEYEFSSRKTIKDWINPEFNNDENIKQVQKLIANTMPQNQQGLIDNNVVYKIKNNDNDNRFYGRTFHAIEVPQLSFLKEVRTWAANRTDSSLKVLEIGAAGGVFSFLIALALDPKKQKHTLIVNDLSKYEVKKAEKLFETRKDNISLSTDNIIFDSGDAKNLLERRSDLTGCIDLCYIQNVEHFMNPIEHQRFLEVVLTLLAPGGKVFCTAHTIPIGYGVKGHKYFDFYITNKKNQDIYPMFAATETIVYELDGQPGGFLPYFELQEILRPEEHVICTGWTKKIGSVMIDGRLFNKLNQINITNNFTPTIYTNAFNKASKSIEAEIEKETDYFIDKAGKRHDVFNNDQEIKFASIIIKKIQ